MNDEEVWIRNQNNGKATSAWHLLHSLRASADKYWGSFALTQCGFTFYNPKKWDSHLRRNTMNTCSSCLNISRVLSRTAEVPAGWQTW